ncbi:MAG: hypothetical protein JWM74_2987 [Myxococcaceae bacterium]|nr:hypothetical protein [Myxococcaceae bacterium]
MRKVGLVVGIAAALGAIWASACGGDDVATDVPDASLDGAGDALGDASAKADASDGAADAVTSQGDGGLITTASPLPSGDMPMKLLRQPDGKYIVVCANVDHYAVVMARVSANGGLDPTFGNGGLAWGQNTYARSAALQSDGKIVVAGYVGIARYDATGNEDTSFKPPTGIDRIANVEGIALQPDGKILTAGTDGSNLRVHRLLATGALDTTFDTDGVVTVSFGGQSTAYAVAVDPVTSKIAAVGYAGGQLGLAVFNADGSPDATFNGTGHVTGAGTFTGSQGATVAFQSDGKIVVAGSGAGEGGSGGVAVRYATTGTVDATFGTGGVFWGGSGVFQSILVRPSGALVLGRANNFVQLTSNGTVDGTFGSSGVASFAGLPQPAMLGPGVVLAPDGSVTGLGSLAPGSDSTPKALWRVTSAGALDTTFGTGGELSFSIHARQDEAHTMVAQADEKVIVGGRSTGYGMIARYLPSGDLDPAFSDGGVRVGGEEIQALTLGDGGTIYIANGFGAEALTPSGNHDPAFGGDAGLTSVPLSAGNWFAPRAIALDGAGRVLLAGYGGGTRPEHVGLIRLLATGVRDTTFGVAGAYEGATDNERIFAVAVDANQKIVLAGFTGAGSSPSQKILLVRLDANGALDPSFDGDTGSGNGIVMATTGSSHEGARAVAIQPDGKILVLANKAEFYDTYDYGATIVLRFAADGKLDTSFGTSGIASSFPGFFARGMELRPDGTILLAGTKTGAGGGLAALRLTSVGAIDASFGAAGTFVAGTTDPSGGWAVATPSTGAPWVAGYVAHSPTGYDFAATRAR